MSRKIRFRWSLKWNKLYWLAGVTFLCCVSGVFAYWTQELTAHNQFKTAKYDTALEEIFVSPDLWCPGQQINKDVWVTNKGNVPAFVKAVINQEWIRQQNVTDLEGKVIAPAAGEAFPLIFEVDDKKEYAAQIRWGEQVALLASGKHSEASLGLPIAEKIEDAAGKWLLVNDQPDQNGNYIFYYIGILESGKTTPLLVDEVMMNPAIEPAILEKNTYYDKETKTWITTVKKNDSYDYECAKYTMTVTALTVQATETAVKEIFGEAAGDQIVVDYLASHAWKATS